MVAYDMNHSKVHVLPARAIGYPRSTWKLLCMSGRPHYLPYVPLFMESLVEQERCICCILLLHHVFVQVGSHYDSIYRPIRAW